MRMNLLDNGCLKILLTEEDLAGLSLTYDELDYNSDSTRIVLHRLLEIARNEIGFNPSASILIEVLPVDGGCLILMTPSGGKRHVRMKRATGPYIFEIDNVDDVLNLARSIGGKIPPLFGSSLYRFNNRYRLIIYPGSPLPKEMGNMLHEFTRAAGEGDAAAAFTAEHGVSIAIGDALTRLCRASCE